MPAFCPSCGNAVEEGSKFCQRCGTPSSQPSAAPPPTPGSQWTPQPPPPSQSNWTPPAAPGFPPTQPNKMKAALLGGLVGGLLSGLPFIAAGNCCFCLWVVLGGVIAVYLYSKEVPEVMSGDAALLGLQSGMVSAVVSTILSIPVRLIMSRFMSGFQREMIDRMLEQQTDFPPQLAEFLKMLSSPGFQLGAIAIGFIFSLVFYSMFGALGGLIGKALFKKK
jgi:hypothetical protein